MRRGLALVLLITAACKDCVGAQSDAELLPELDESMVRMGTPEGWRYALYHFERFARMYRRPELANRVARLKHQTDLAQLPEGLCRHDEINDWVDAHLQRLRAEFRGKPTNPVSPVICGSVPRPIIRRIDRSWTIHGLDLNTDAAQLSLVVSSSTSQRHATDALRVESPTRAQVRLGADGAALQPFDRELTLFSAGTPVAQTRINDVEPALRITTTRERSEYAAHPTVTATIPADHVLIGGGCRPVTRGVGQFLVTSRPLDRGWQCRSKDHLEPSPGYVVAYALSIPDALGIPVAVVTSTSPLGGVVQAQAILPAHLRLVGGGCQIARATRVTGHLLTAMTPANNSFECRATDHLQESMGMVSAYALGIPRDVPFAVSIEALRGDAVRTGRVSPMLMDTRHVLVGGGCAVTQSGKGNLVQASFPRAVERRWICVHGNHDFGDLGVATGFALGLRAD